LWNGEAGDGRGGTEDMIKQAKARGATVNVLDTARDRRRRFHSTWIVASG
jgi:hypothetical protein